MLTAEGCRGRRQRFWDQLEVKPDWAIIRDPKHLMYLTGFWLTPFEFRSEDGGAMLLLGKDGSSILVADSMIASSAKAAHVDEVHAPVWYDGNTSAVHRQMLLVRSTLDRLQQCPGDHIGYEAAQVPAGVIDGLKEKRPHAKFTAVDPILFRIKRQKDADELDIIRRSMAAGDAGHRAGMGQIAPGMTELEAWLLVQAACIRELGEQAIVYGDFATGPRTEKKGGPPTHRAIEKGDLVLLDFSVVVHGYRGDFANTFICGGVQPSAELTKNYDACMAAIAAGEALLKPGQPAKDVDKAVRDAFAQRGLLEHFTTHSGHGVGLGHPAAPYLVPASVDELLVGEVVTIEPGLYVDGLGGMRYERNYLITESGYETLSHLELKLDPNA